MHFAQKTKPEGEAVGSCGAMRHVGHTLECDQAFRPAGSGGSSGGGGTGTDRCEAEACCGACQCSRRRKPKTDMRRRCCACRRGSASTEASCCPLVVVGCGPTGAPQLELRPET